MSEEGLTVAVTGPTGTFGFGLIPLLQADDRIARIIGIARRPFDPAETAGPSWNTGRETSAIRMCSAKRSKVQTGSSTSRS